MRGSFRSFTSLAQQSTRDPQGSFGLFNIDGFRKNQIGADAEGLGDSGLSFDHSHGERRLIGSRVTSAFEKQGRVLFVVAIHHDSVKMLGHEPLDGAEWLAARLYAKVQFTKHLRHRTGRLLIWTEQ